MKIKSMKIPALITLIIVFVSRVCQLIFISDSAVRANWENIEIGCFALAALSIIVMAFLTIPLKKVSLNLEFDKSKSTAFFGIVAGVAMICKSLYGLVNYISSYNGLMPIISDMLCILSGIFFIFIGIGFSKGKNMFQNIGVITLVPVVWGILRLFELFFTYYSSSNKLWAVPDEFAIIFLLLFLLNQARVFGNIDHRKKFVKLMLWGFSAVIFIFIYVSNSLINELITYRKISIGVLIPTVMYLLVAAYVMSLLKLINKNEPVVIDEIAGETTVNEKPENEQNNKTDNESPGFAEMVKEAAENYSEEEQKKDTEMAKIDELINDIKKEENAE